MAGPITEEAARRMRCPYSGLVASCMASGCMAWVQVMEQGEETMTNRAVADRLTAQGTVEMVRPEGEPWNRNMVVVRYVRSTGQCGLLDRD